MVEIVGPKDKYIDDVEDVLFLADTRLDYASRQKAFEDRMRPDWDIAGEERNLEETERLAKLAEKELDAAVLAGMQKVRDAIWANFNAKKLQTKIRRGRDSNLQAVLAEEKMRMSLPEVVYADWNVDYVSLHEDTGISKKQRISSKIDPNDAFADLHPYQKLPKRGKYNNKTRRILIEKANVVEGQLKAAIREVLGKDM